MEHWALRTLERPIWTVIESLESCQRYRCILQVALVRRFTQGADASQAVPDLQLNSPCIIAFSAFEIAQASDFLL